MILSNSNKSIQLYNLLKERKLLQTELWWWTRHSNSAEPEITTSRTDVLLQSKYSSGKSCHKGFQNFSLKLERNWKKHVFLRFLSFYKRADNNRSTTTCLPPYRRLMSCANDHIWVLGPNLPMKHLIQVVGRSYLFRRKAWVDHRKWFLSTISVAQVKWDFTVLCSRQA